MRKITEAQRYYCQRLCAREVESQFAKGDLSGVLQKPYLGEEVVAMIKRAVKNP